MERVNMQTSLSSAAEVEVLSTFCNGLEHGIWVLNSKFEILYHNDSSLGLMCLKQKAHDIERSFHHIVELLAQRGDFGRVEPKSFTRDFIRKLMLFSEAASPEPITFSICPPNGSILTWKWRKLPKGFLVATVEDVTEQFNKNKAQESALYLGRAGYFIYNFDTDQFSVHGRFLHEKLTDAEKSRIYKKGFWTILHKDDKARAIAAWRDAREKVYGLQETVRIESEKAGSLWFKFDGKVFEYNDVRKGIMICHFEDVTETLRLQNTLTKAKNSAEKTLRSQNDFLARLSHEIRTPMNAVIGIADALAYRTQDPKQLMQLELIQSASDTIMNILNSTLSYSKIDANKMELDPKEVSAAHLVQTVCRSWEPKASKGNSRIICEIDETVPEKLIFDPHRYEQCLNNLLSNAVKFTTDGLIKVSLTTIKTAKGRSRLVLVVKDTGIGMSPEQQANVFEPFAQADQSISGRFGGSGLGMNIVKDIVKLMGGTISVKSALGRGTVFAVALPMKFPKLDVKPVSTTQEALVNHILGDEQVSQESAYKDLKILVVDDNETNHLVVQSLLEHLVPDISSVYNGREALEHLETNPVDIVLMDIHMPIMDGLEATMAIRRSGKPYSDVSIIALTADPDYQQLRLCRNIGMDETLGKPVKLAEILEAIDKVSVMDKENAPYREIYKAAG